MPIPIERARAAKDAAKARLADLPELVGVGLTKVGDDYAVKINLRAELPGDVSVPEEIDGVPIRVEIVGEIRPRQ